MVRRVLVAPLLLCFLGVSEIAAPQVAQDSDAMADAQDFGSVMRLLLRAVETLAGYQASVDLPPVFQVPQHVIEQKVCDAPCNVRAAYIPREGIYLAGNLDPVREPLDRAALLHELIHYLQQGHPKFAGLRPCEREREKEREAYAVQNAYLAAIKRSERVVFYDGEFDCDGAVATRSP
jgi:hypothetical protein